MLIYEINICKASLYISTFDAAVVLLYDITC